MLLRNNYLTIVNDNKPAPGRRACAGRLHLVLTSLNMSSGATCGAGWGARGRAGWNVRNVVAEWHSARTVLVCSKPGARMRQEQCG